MTGAELIAKIQPILDDDKLEPRLFIIVGTDLKMPSLGKKARKTLRQSLRRSIGKAKKILETVRDKHIGGFVACRDNDHVHLYDLPDKLGFIQRLDDALTGNADAYANTADARSLGGVIFRYSLNGRKIITYRRMHSISTLQPGFLALITKKKDMVFDRASKNMMMVDTSIDVVRFVDSDGTFDLILSPQIITETDQYKAQLRTRRGAVIQSPSYYDIANPSPAVAPVKPAENKPLEDKSAGAPKRTTTDPPTPAPTTTNPGSTVIPPQYIPTVLRTSKDFTPLSAPPQPTPPSNSK